MTLKLVVRYQNNSRTLANQIFIVSHSKTHDRIKMSRDSQSEIFALASRISSIIKASLMMRGTSKGVNAEAEMTAYVGNMAVSPTHAGAFTTYRQDRNPLRRSSALNWRPILSNAFTSLGWSLAPSRSINTHYPAHHSKGRTCMRYRQMIQEFIKCHILRKADQRHLQNVGNNFWSCPSSQVGLMFLAHCG